MEFPIEKINYVNWDFPKSKTQFLTHKYHSYPARFIPQIPRTIYNICLNSSGSRIFDPFVGCGTSLVEGILSRNHTGGVDQNPLAILISRVKTRPLDINSLNNYWKSFQKITQHKNSIFQIKTNPKSLSNKEEQYTPREFIFPNRNLSIRFTDDNIQAISLILDHIEEEVINTQFQDFFRVGLSAVITTLTESKNWRKVNIWNTFRVKINSMIHIMDKFNRKVMGFSNDMQEDIKLGDSRKISFISDETIDCVVTSPPYVNALDYNRIHQYNMSILGYDYRAFAKAEIGAHGHHISNRWRLLTEYLADMAQSIVEMNRVTKQGGVICIIIGDSCLEYENISSHSHFKELGKLLGLTHQLSLSRNIDATSKSTSNDIGNIFSEYLIFFTKDNEFEKGSANLIHEYIENTLYTYLDHVKTSTGTCLRNKAEISTERQELAVQRVEEAISKIKEDYRSV
ncbi:MAG: DNA methyltransferase [Promethearchaeota archaeon]